MNTNCAWVAEQLPRVILALCNRSTVESDFIAAFVRRIPLDPTQS
jgi:hypothetical protein